MDKIKETDTSKLLGFDRSGEPLFDIVQTFSNASSATRAAGNAKNGGIGKAAGDVKL